MDSGAEMPAKFCQMEKKSTDVSKFADNWSDEDEEKHLCVAAGMHPRR